MQNLFYSMVYGLAIGAVAAFAGVRDSQAQDRPAAEGVE